MKTQNLLRGLFIALCILTWNLEFGTWNGFSQNVEFTKDNFKDNKDGMKAAVKNIKQGDEFYNNGTMFYKKALEFYLMASAFNPNNDELNFKIGKCYLFSSFKYKSLSFLQKAFSLNAKIDADIHLLLADAYHYNLEWDKAIDEYNTYKKNIPPKKKDVSTLLVQINKKIEECNNGKELVKKPIRVWIDNLGVSVNTKYPEYGPIISADESVLMFTSRRDNTTGAQVDESLGEYFEDIYVSYKTPKGWSSAVNIGPPINTPEHDATVALSPDGQTLYIYKDDKGDGNIYECKIKGDKWSKPDKLPKPINTDSHESNASLTYDGKTLYFVSNRPGGIGGRDIYYCTKNAKGKWDKAVNIGTTINTPYNEEGVVMMPDGKTMYFSSQGHNSMGGYDVFRSVFENGQWSKPENIGYPINTADDDVFFVMSASGKHAYFSSIKNDGFGDKDVYMITFLGPEKQIVMNTEDNLIASITSPVSETVIAPVVAIKTSKVTILKGVVTDAATKQPLEASIELVDNQLNVVIADFASNAKTGKYLVSLPSGKNYGIAVKANNYLFHSENLNIPDTANFQEIVKNIELKSLAVGSTIVLNNIFFDFDKATLRPESQNELDRLVKLLNDYPSMKIEISGHTDNKGSATYNQTLSENRSKSVVDYLISKSINKARLTYKGYGLTVPIASNDTDEGRQLNRRTEFKITGK